MSPMDHPKVGRGERMFATLGLLAVVLVGCSRAPSVEVSAGGVPPPPPVASDEPASRFQGAVSSVDVASRELVLDVHIVWTPVLTAERGQRRVVIGPQTRWDPVQTGLEGLLVGEEVQVEADTGPDGTWQARRIQLLDID